jgi:PRTRC genetic system ThiF family protein
MDFKMMLEPTYVLDVQSKRAKHWIIVGAGGTAGYFIPNLIRQISLQNRILKYENRPGHTVTIIDADDVEDKNLTRQNFIQRDVGYNKAEVMANRYGAAFGIEITYIPEYLESAKMLQRIIDGDKNMPIVVGCVDNNATRALIHEVFKNNKNMFWLDSGNEEWAGQVVCGYNAGYEVKKDVKTPQIFNLPCVADIYPEIMDGGDKLPTEMSCAERAVSNPQNIQTNQTAANQLMTYANTILTADAREGNGLKSHQVIFDVTTPSYSTTLNKYRNLVKEPEPVVEEPKAVEVEVAAPKKRAPRKKKTETTEEATA